jgi:hypothetical protein
VEGVGKEKPVGCLSWKSGFWEVIWKLCIRSGPEKLLFEI